MPARRLSSARHTAITSASLQHHFRLQAAGNTAGLETVRLNKECQVAACRRVAKGVIQSTSTGTTMYALLPSLCYMLSGRRWVMHLAREGRPDIKVEDVVDIARAAGRVILDVYKEDPEVN